MLVDLRDGVMTTALSDPPRRPRRGPKRPKFRPETSSHGHESHGRGKSTLKNAWAVISFVASCWRFHTPSLCVSASKCILHFGLTRTSNLREARRRSRGRSDGVAVRMRRADAVDAKLKFLRNAESAPAHVEQ